MTQIGKPIRTTLNTYCFETFKNKNNAIKVSSFFKTFLKYPKGSRSSKELIRTINTILLERGEDILLSAIDYFMDGYKWGTITDISIEHFINLVRKFELPKEVIVQSTEFNDKEIKVSFPVRVEHVRPDEYPKYPRFEYNHKCSQCGNVHDPWQVNCPTCNALIDWTKEK